MIECFGLRRGSWALLTEYKGGASSLSNADMFTLCNVLLMVSLKLLVCVVYLAMVRRGQGMEGVMRKTTMRICSNVISTYQF